MKAAAVKSFFSTTMLVINDVGQTTDNTTRDLWFTCHTDELYFQEILLSLDD